MKALFYILSFSLFFQLAAYSQKPSIAKLPGYAVMMPNKLPGKPCTCTNLSSIASSTVIDGGGTFSINKFHNDYKDLTFSNVGGCFEYRWEADVCDSYTSANYPAIITMLANDKVRIQLPNGWALHGQDQTTVLRANRIQARLYVICTDEQGQKSSVVLNRTIHVYFYE